MIQRLSLLSILRDWREKGIEFTCHLKCFEGSSNERLIFSGKIIIQF
jgi:hypothetical protein